MYYDITKDHGLPRDPYKACIAPRPIGWISTVSADGVPNLAPYSFFNAVSEFPRMVAVCVNGVHAAGDGRCAKDTLRNIEEVPEFVVNVSTWDLKDEMNHSCLATPPGVDEFEQIGLEKSAARFVRPPRVKRSPINLECTVHQLVELPEIPDGGGRNVIIVGRVLGIHIDDAVMTDGRIDVNKVRPLGRLGYSDYVVVGGTDVFAMRRPE